MENIKHSFINLGDPMIFSSFGGEEFWERVDAAAGQMIVSEGEATQDFYYVLSGTLEVLKALGDEAGHQKVLAQLQAGDIFGEGALLSDSGRGASVRASSASQLLKLSRAKFEALVVADPQAAVGLTLGIVKIQNARLAHMNARLVALTNVAKLSTSFAGNPTQVIPAILEELKRVVPGDHLLFNGEGLVAHQSLAANADPFQMKIPDLSRRFVEAGAPAYFVEENLVFCPVRDLEGQLRAVLASKFERGLTEEDLRFSLSVSELLGNLF